MKKYVNAKEVLPESLIKEIQKYVKGQHIYIPQTERKDWGTSTGIRDEMEQRNEDITRKYHGGLTIAELAAIFNLSEERIRGIIYERQSD
ncbi:Mor family transcriptional regulator [Paenibacillus sp. V4I9]|uniref:CD3324 family protein n=1 Tax=Paenibacillus sp. V4I9 TaxID=3042308 RepID=UPI002781F8A9|nr:CD3324 family protein [Paenibacillus sp. V4I9]MDQ0888888.1 Mor family transcriptional regulator [Paenibacillus sp. V4I9]